MVFMSYPEAMEGERDLNDVCPFFKNDPILPLRCFNKNVFKKFVLF